MYGQLGGQVLADDGTRIALDDDKAAKVLEFQRELTLTRKLMPSNIDGNGVTQLFSGGKAGLLFDGEWQLPTYQSTKIKFSVAPVPNIMGGAYHCWPTPHALILPRDAARDEYKRDTALGFVRGLLDASMIWAEGGHVPAWRSIQQSATFKALQPQAEYVPAAEAAVYDPPAWYSGAGSDFENIMGFAVAACEAGQLTPEAAIRQLRAKLDHRRRDPAARRTGTDRHPRRPRTPGRMGAPCPVRRSLPAVPDRPRAVRAGDELLRHQLGAQRARAVRRPRKLRGGVR